ncbi:bifunctional riboflavin kinase/FAD synthetase [Alicyclobacillus sp. SO9]|uniref:bifunctional riboflavin kinase/FAD synthetase n=1 Tax=Alicyclobacillus sp. SO9 TaxID=2665646 RepID=UPI0018E81EBD|nr:bifunctional riboflavin kinase/FAD synthetase [Alicyclobacillus sp. SO9]QQE80848.1 bifunctional riboflavin kinase/FAD synthetase [Alicyclobacillus sp. SO9]
MEIFEISKIPPESTTAMVLAIGKFDGIHIGHKAILQRAKTYQSQADDLAVMSLWPHPAWVLGGQKAYERSLTPFGEKVRRLEEQGVDKLYSVQFSTEYAKISAQEFVREHLSRLKLKRVVVGEDFHFGAGGKADVADLTRLCEDIGIPVTVVDHVEEHGIKVSSSQIREHITAGRVDAAEALLGRSYCIHGRVVEGDKRGRTIGFPTANLQETDLYVLPGSGVYAVSVALVQEGYNEQNWFGVMNVGVRPTVDGTKFQMEVHLLDFTGDLYGHIIEVSLLGRVRDEQKFESIEALKEQITRDVKTVREMFGLVQD